MDITSQLDAVDRAVGRREREDGEAAVVTMRQTYQASSGDVWDACTNAERIPRWLMPVTGDLRLGGTYQLAGNAGGTILACRPERSFSVTWEYGGEVSWVDVLLDGPGAGPTTVTIVHVAPFDPERWAEFGPGGVGIGWDMMLLGLAQHLAGSAAITPEEAMRWSASEEGLAFMRGSGDRWREAHVAGGENAVAARAAAERTMAAYTPG
jgi:uncharacterized protein YndB with AHSA1/START domain